MKTTMNISRLRRSRFDGTRNSFGDFVCITCHNFVSAAAVLSNVHNRNHCPYCLSSRHLDLYEAGDRLSACKARMRPVAVTLKRSHKKYAGAKRGELMLVHKCDDCGKLSINRIAADDDAGRVLALFEALPALDPATRSALSGSGIPLLEAADRSFVRRQLLGRA
jgi:hypothetical protein